MEQKENIVILSLDEYNKLVGENRILCNKIEKLSEIKKLYEILKLEYSQICLKLDIERNSHDTTMIRCHQLLTQITKLEKEKSFARLVRCVLLKTKRNVLLLLRLLANKR